MNSALESIDLEDPAFYAADPYKAYRQIRARGNIFWYEARRVWAVLAYRDVSTILRDGRTFVSSKGCFLSDAGAGRSITFGYMFGDHNTVLPLTDPPRHDEIRRAIGRMFTPKRVEQLRYDIEQICHDLIFNIEPNVPFDFVEKVASVLPLSVGALVLGISSSDMSYIKRCIAGVDSAVSEVVEPGSLDDHVEKVRSSLRAFFADTAISIAAQIAVGGIGTTRALLSGIIECLDHYPLERMRLVKDRSLVPSAIEETLRWKTPGGRGFLRTATCDAYLGGRRIQAGDQVYVMLDAANRDPEAFANPETFDITCRRGNGNLSFGLGVHACIGAPLARVEAEVLLASLIQRFTDWWVVDGDRTWSYFRNGWVRLLARFDDRRL